MSPSHAIKHIQAFDYNSVKLQTASTEIRLLELYPSQSHDFEDEADEAADPTWDDRLVCRLHTTTIEKPSPPFKALSYVWGDGNKTRSIWVISSPGGKFGQCGETSIPITESLDTALRHLRRRRETITLWIDQICINQADNGEKSEQVGMMGSIYSRAKQVLVWLGPAGGGSDALMDAWQDIGQWARDLGLESYLTRERFHLLSPIMTNENPANEATMHFQDLIARTAGVFAPLMREGVLSTWFERPYFKRAWIVQEFCLCANTVFVYGAKVVPVELITLAFLMLQFAIGNTSRSECRALQMPEMSRERLQEILEEPTDRLFSCRSLHQKHAGDQLHMLLRKLFVNHDTRASEHRDRVFALLGLAVDADRLGIRPDYVSSEGGTGRILTQTARALIERSGRVDTLCYSQFPKVPGLAGLPSWVPDWRSNLRPSFYTVNKRIDQHLFAAAGQDSVVEAIPALKDDPNILGLRGYMVDVIEKVAEGGGWMDLSWDHIRYLGFFAQVDELWQCSMDKDYPIHGKSTQRRKEEARWRVPIGDIYWTVEGDSQRATPDVAIYHDQCLKHLQHFDEMSRLASAGEDGWHRQAGWGGATPERADWTEVPRQHEHYARKAAVSHRNGVSRHGPCGGAARRCGCHLLRWADPLCIASVRPARSVPGGEHSVFSFVGEAYCDGVMDGEIAARGKRTFFLA